MSTHLERMQSGFINDAKLSASKVATKRINLNSSSSEHTSTQQKRELKEQKRKREQGNVVFSQPAATGYGTEAFTQVTYVIEFLKKKDEPKKFQEILLYLSQVNADERKKRLIAKILKQHDRVKWTPDPNLKIQTWDSGLFEHCPIINVRTEDDLLRYLQKMPNAQGVSVKDLKDGWPDCDSAIDKLEKEHRILVTRTKKDNHARMVWSDDPTLAHNVDPEFQVMWHRVELPSVDELVRKLLDASQKPASEDPSKRIKAAPKAKEKKKRAPRSGGKTTNTHMAVRTKSDSLRSPLTIFVAFAQGFFPPQTLVIQS
ncbi:putative transcription initiation factor iie subunit beta [Erysiphe necator]|uniref:Transcription initiation factor IIE subunit beta n=1 Tax=Uncinula necator TaxID=52586 RepID=A0A0B1P1C2_UNCNE|nr:putative transcription initiation factor iie subunit beta [Erysiphe necator]